MESLIHEGFRNGADKTKVQSEKKITLSELKSVLYKMDFYKRTNGFIAHDLSGNLTFFDSEPSFGGDFVTREDIVKFINEY